MWKTGVGGGWVRVSRKQRLLVSLERIPQVSSLAKLPESQRRGLDMTLPSLQSEPGCQDMYNNKQEDAEQGPCCPERPAVMLALSSYIPFPASNTTPHHTSNYFC